MQTIRAIAQFVAGKKTYAVGAMGIIYAFGVSRNWWPNDVTIWGALGSTGAMTLRAALAKSIAQVTTDLTCPPVRPGEPLITTQDKKPLP